MHGGVAQGIAQALFEEAVYDESGNLITGSFAEYLLPSSADLPDIVTDRTETPATTHPLGVKGVGEAGTIASTPAVVNAIVDALRPRGVNDIQMPCTPGAGVAGGSAPASTGRQVAGSMIPVAFDYVRPVHGGRGGRRALGRGRRGRRRCWPAGRACCRCCGCGWPRRPSWSTWAGSPRCAASGSTATTLVIGAMTTHAEVGLVRPGAGRGAAGRRRGRDRRRPRRSATGARSAAPSPTPTRPVTCPPRRSRSTRRWWWPGRPGSARVAARDFFTDMFTTALAPDEVLVEVRFPRMAGLDRQLREVPPHGPGVGGGRRRGGGPAGERRHRRGPGRADQHGSDAGAGDGGGGGTCRRRGSRYGESPQRRTPARQRRHRRTSPARPSTGGTSPACSPPGPWRRPPGCRLDVCRSPVSPGARW